MYPAAAAGAAADVKLTSPPLPPEVFLAPRATLPERTGDKLELMQFVEKLRVKERREAELEAQARAALDTLKRADVGTEESASSRIVWLDGDRVFMLVPLPTATPSTTCLRNAKRAGAATSK
ncbi:hypothetical protein EON67_07325 [archaeon]|nr:MAG: hypothetical protein EON67_07325 [archaeon]